MKEIDLMIIGTQKAGTSSLLRLLAQHPDVASHITGELGYFVLPEEIKLGFAKVYKKYFPEVGDQQKLIAKNVGIFESKSALQELKKHNPNIKIVVTLREPVSRAYSSFWYMKSIGAERANKFEDIMDEDVRTRYPNNSFMIRSCDYLNRGRYHKYLQQLESVFDRSQILILNFDDMKKDSVSFCNGVFKFMEVTDFDVTPKLSNKSTKIKYTWIANMFGGHYQHPIKSFLSNHLPPKIRLFIKTKLKRINSSTEEIPKLDSKIANQLSKRFKEDNRLLARDYGIEFDA